MYTRALRLISERVNICTRHTPFSLPPSHPPGKFERAFTGVTRCTKFLKPKIYRPVIVLRKIYARFILRPPRTEGEMVAG